MLSDSTTPLAVHQECSRGYCFTTARDSYCESDSAASAASPAAPASSAAPPALTGCPAAAAPDVAAANPGRSGGPSVPAPVCLAAPGRRCRKAPHSMCSVPGNWSKIANLHSQEAISVRDSSTRNVDTRCAAAAATTAFVPNVQHDHARVLQLQMFYQRALLCLCSSRKQALFDGMPVLDLRQVGR